VKLVSIEFDFEIEVDRRTRFVKEYEFGFRAVEGDFIGKEPLIK
jgi:hypothetical protein